MLNEQPVLIWSITQNKWISTLIYFVDQPATTTNILDIDGAGDQTSVVTPASVIPLNPTAGYQEILPLGSIFPTSETWYIDHTKTKKIMEKVITWLSVVPINIIYTFYAADGLTIMRQIQDEISYTKKIFVSNVVRTILI
jgi:hypothetical protein